MLHLLWDLEWEDVFTRGTGTGTRGCHTQSGWEAMRAKTMVARNGYVSVGRESTTDSRPAPVPSGPPREFLSHCYPCKVLKMFKPSMMLIMQAPQQTRHQGEN